MELGLDFISLVVLAAFVFVNSTRGILRLKNPGKVNLSVPVSYLGVTCILVAQIMLLLEQLSVKAFMTVVSVTLPLLFGLLLFQCSYLAIFNVTSKKVNTLWKSPLLAGLAGMYLGVSYSLVLCSGLFLVGAFVLLRQKEALAFALRSYLPFAFCLLGLYFFQLDQFLFLNLALISFILTAERFFDLVYISTTIEISERGSGELV